MPDIIMHLNFSMGFVLSYHGGFQKESKSCHLIFSKYLYKFSIPRSLFLKIMTCLKYAGYIFPVTVRPQAREL